MTNTPHYLRVVLALAATTLPACSAAPNPTSEDESTAAVDGDHRAQPNERLAPRTEEDAAVATAAPDASADDAAHPHTSGPIVPPELA
jgi:hypothetical protein